MTNIISFIVAIFLCCLSGPSLAWNKIKIDGSCAFGATFDGPGDTTFIVTQNKEDFDRGFLIVAVSNQNWTIQSGDKLADVMKFSSLEYDFWEDPVAIDKGFALHIKAKTLEEFAYSHPFDVKIFKGKQVIDSLNFSGFYAEHIMFQACTRPWKEEADEKARMENIIKNIPLDPFAKQAK